jgi:hypothetical protein
MKIMVKVKPGASQNSIARISDKEYFVHVKAQAEKNKANLELVKLISKEFKVPASRIRIKNKLSRTKIIEIQT